MSQAVSYPKDRINILLLEGIHPVTKEKFAQAGYSAKLMKGAMNEDELVKAIQGVHLLGIRSKTNVTPRVLEAAKNLLAIGCFCIGTDQVALDAAASSGIPVYNAPFSNTRSVAELTIAEVIMLARRAAHKSQLLHRGIWEKSAEGCVEVRQKTIGVIGYGHIGPQVGLLAEALGMQVYFYDIVTKLPLGNARAVASLDELLAMSDFVTLHVPETTDTRGLIGKRELERMKRGACLLNLSRGSVVDLDALAEALEEGRLGGAAIDVFPREPYGNDEPFESVLRGIDNVILTPHIGGSTLEAQHNIGIEVFTSMTRFLEIGSTTGAVNFPQVDLPLLRDSHRVLNIHRNVPGVLGSINSIVAEMGVNIRGQYLGTRNDIGYLIMDVDREDSHAIKTRVDQLDTSIRTRLLY